MFTDVFIPAQHRVFAKLLLSLMLKPQPAEYLPLHSVCTDTKSCIGQAAPGCCLRRLPLWSLKSVNFPVFIAQGGADANAEDAGGQKAIHAAAAEKHRDIVELLLPQTTPDDDNAADWTVEGVIQEAQQSITEDQPDQQQHQV